MTSPAGPSKEERKKARRRARAEQERAAAKALEALADEAVEQALGLVAEVAAAPDQASSERGIDVACPTVDAARYVRKRINAALAYDEWLDEVQVWVWEETVHTRPPLTQHGKDNGVEVRLEKPGQTGRTIGIIDEE